MANIHIPLPTEKVRETEKKIIEGFAKKRQSAFEKFPLTFTLLGTFGLVATYYGFEAIINRIDILYNNPFILLASGIVALALTGTLYKKLK